MNYGSMNIPSGQSYKINGVALAAGDVGALAATGTPAIPSGATATTQTNGDNSTKIATTAYADYKLSTTDRNNSGSTAWTSSLRAPTQAAIETALADCGVRLTNRASSLTSNDLDKMVVASYVAGGGITFNSAAVDATSASWRGVWKFEAGALTTDFNGGGGTLSVEGSPSESALGKSGGCVQYGSGSHYWPVGVAYDRPAYDFFSCWLYRQDNDGDIFGYCDSNTNRLFGAYVSSGTIYWSTISGSNTVYTQTTSAPAQSEWHHVAAYQDATDSKMYCYVDGSLVATVTYVGTPCLFHGTHKRFALGIAADLNTGMRLTCRMDEALLMHSETRLFTDAGAAVVAALYNSGTGLFAEAVAAKDYRLATTKTTDLVLLSGDQTIAGTKTFSSTISGSVNGSAASCTGNAATSTKTTNIVGGNDTTLLGALPYQSGTDTTTLLSPNTSATKKYLAMTGDGTNGAAPVWDTVTAGIGGSTGSTDMAVLIANGTGGSTAQASNATITSGGSMNIVTGQAYQINSVNMLHRGAGSRTGNLFVGDGGASLTASGTGNTSMGLSALANTTDGSRNTAVGYQALNTNVGGQRSTAVGYQAMYNYSNDAGGVILNNVAIGYQAIGGGDPSPANNTGGSNTAVGTSALTLNTSGSNNVAVGFEALRYNGTGSANVAIGGDSLYSNADGLRNIAIGYYALYTNAGKSSSTAIGFNAMRYGNSSGVAGDVYNTAIGAYALRGGTTASLNTGTQNTAVGANALFADTSGGDNVAIGYNAAYVITSGIGNVYIGSGADASGAAVTNEIAIGQGVTGSGSNTVTIGKSATTQTNLFGDVNIPSGKVYKINNVALSASDVGALASSGTPAIPSGATATTQTAGDNSTKLATTAYSDRFPVDMSRYGFVNRTETTISFDGTSSFTVAPTSSSWSYYRSGVKRTITGSKSVTVASPMVDATRYFIFIDSVDGTLSASTSSWTLADTKVPVAILMWNNTLTPKYLLFDERHTCAIDRAWHYEHHFVEGTEATTVGAISGMQTASNTSADKVFGITASNIVDEDIPITVSALTKPDGATAVYYNVYRASSGTQWLWAASDMPFKYTGTSPYTAIEYDNGGNTQAGTNSNFVNTYLILTNVVANSEANPSISTSAQRYMILQGRSQFSTAALAYAENFAAFDLSGFPAAEGMAVYQFTWLVNNTTTSKGRCTLNRQPVRVASNVIQSNVTSTVSHNSLSGIQGGTSNEYYHLTNAQLDGLVYTSGGQTIAGTEVFSGTVNVGSASPVATKLNVVTTGANDAEAWIGTTAGNVTGNTASLYLAPQLGFSTTSITPRIYAYATTADSGSAQLRFDVYKGGVGRITGMTLDQSGNLDVSGVVSALGGNNPTYGGFHLSTMAGTTTLTPRLTNDADDTTVLRPGKSGGRVEIHNFANSASTLVALDGGSVGVNRSPTNGTILDIYSSSTSNVSLLAEHINGNGVYVMGNTFNGNYGAAATADLWINYAGYTGGNTQYRNLAIGDGKNNAFAYFDGVNKLMGIGTTSPSSYSSAADDLVVYNSSNGGITIAAATAGYLMFADGTSGAQTYAGYIQYTHSTNSMILGTNNADALVINNSGVVTISNLGTGTVTASSGVLSASSDARLKTEDQGPRYGLDTVMAMIPRHYTWNTGDRADYGFFAQDFLTVLPEAVGAPDPRGYYGLFDRPIVAALVKAVQELKAEVDALNIEIGKLKTN